MILDKDLTAESLLQNIVEFLDRDRRREMSDAMTKLARKDAAKTIAEDILGWIL